MNLTAKDMHNSPAQAYREADKGNTVTINHDRYPDKVFELTARERRTLIDTSFDSMSFDRIKNRLPESIDENGNHILTWVSPFQKEKDND